MTDRVDEALQTVADWLAEKVREIEADMDARMGHGYGGSPIPDIGKARACLDFIERIRRFRGDPYMRWDRRWLEDPKWTGDF